MVSGNRDGATITVSVVSDPQGRFEFPAAKLERIAKAASLLIRGLAYVGIVALVDEATGYQEVRDKRALQSILDKYLRKELAAWAKRFPDEFCKEMFVSGGGNGSAFPASGLASSAPTPMILSMNDWLLAFLRNLR